MATDTTNKTKVLMVSHGHPDINPGGGEIAAYNLFSEINNTEGYDSLFFARHDQVNRCHGGTSFSGTGKDNEILFYVPMGNWFRFTQPDSPKIWRDFRETLELYKPDVVHFHHYVHLGIEMLREVKNYNPDVKIVLTLHEYFGICHNFGQMVKNDSGRLCHKSTPSDCSSCFPEHTPQDFFLRKQFIQSHFELVDCFISPSNIVRDRYVDWGIDSSKIRVIENIDREREQAVNRLTAQNKENRKKIRISFFGQINWFKGVDILIDSINYLPKNIRKKVVININGSGLENQPQEMQKYVKESVNKSDGVIRLRGRYERTELADLMNGSDWVVIPSRWWENSPMVILEAKKYGVPVICSNIGGMAEKIDHLQTGLHFQMGRPDSLAEQITWAVENQDITTELAQNISKEYDPSGDLDSHLSLYKYLLEDEGVTEADKNSRTDYSYAA